MNLAIQDCRDSQLPTQTGRLHKVGGKSWRETVDEQSDSPPGMLKYTRWPLRGGNSFLRGSSIASRSAVIGGQATASLD